MIMLLVLEFSSEIDLYNLVNLTQKMLFTFGEFTHVLPSAGPSFSAQQTWAASVPVQRFDLSAQRPELQVGSRVGLCIQNDNGSTNNPILSVGMEISII